MRFSALATLSTLAVTAQAHIDSISVPATINYRSDVVVQIHTSIGQGAWRQVAVSLGLTYPDEYSNLNTIGEDLGTVNFSNLGDNNSTVSLNAYKKGEARIRAAVFSSMGTPSLPFIDILEANVTLGSTTGTKYVTLKRINQIPNYQ